MSDDLRYLFEDTRWGTVSAQFARLEQPPDDALVSNVNVVPFIDENVVVVRVETGEYEIPGGTREAGESIVETIARELREEAGARLLDYTPFGAWRCFSSREKPYKPHLPHPVFYRLVGYGNVQLVSVPTNPDDGEQVVSVEVVTVEQAAERFTGCGRPDLADLYRLAARLRDGAAKEAVS
jgi:8-oxo-dGTP pyrophosphatase MutT (NUDIX family)